MRQLSCKAHQDSWTDHRQWWLVVALLWFHTVWVNNFEPWGNSREGTGWLIPSCKRRRHCCLFATVLCNRSCFKASWLVLTASEIEIFCGVISILNCFHLCLEASMLCCCSTCAFAMMPLQSIQFGRGLLLFKGKLLQDALDLCQSRLKFHKKALHPNFTDF